MCRLVGVFDIPCTRHASCTDACANSATRASLADDHSIASFLYRSVRVFTMTSIPRMSHICHIHSHFCVEFFMITHCWVQFSRLVFVLIFVFFFFFNFYFVNRNIPQKHPPEYSHKLKCPSVSIMSVRQFVVHMSVRRVKKCDRALNPLLTVLYNTVIVILWYQQFKALLRVWTHGTVYYCSVIVIPIV